jgi:hypothetical protein
MVSVHYHLFFEQDVIVLIDIGTGQSITNGIETVLTDLAETIENLGQYRIIYRDTMQIYDGIAHNGSRFVGFVPLRTRDRTNAIEMARAGINAAGNPWPL